MSQKTEPKSESYNLIDILNEILESKKLQDIASDINVAVGTIRRWIELKNVPSHYTFEILTLAKIDIDYSKFSYKEKDQFFTPKATAEYCYSKFIKVLNEYKDCEKNYTFIEPAAGNGVFLKILPTNRRIGLDIEPNFDDLKKLHP